MTRYGILALVVLALGISTTAQTSASSQGSSNTSVGAETNGPAGTSAGASQQNNQSAAASKQGSGTSKSASAAGNNSSAASANANGKSASVANGTPIQAALVTPLDAKHSKPGDPVVAKTTQDVKQDGQTVLKKGSRLNGHVTQAQPRSGANSESSLGMVFDNAVTKNGQQVPMNMSVQALAAAANQTSSSLGGDEGMIDSGSQVGGGFAGSAVPAGGGLARGAVGGGGSAIGGVGGAAGGVGSTAGGATHTAGSATGNAGQSVHGVNGTVGGATSTTGSAVGNVGGLNSAGQLTSGSSGVFGLQGLNLTSAASNGTTASVVNSTSRNVHLDSGTQMVLQVVNQ